MQEVNQNDTDFQIGSKNNDQNDKKNRVYKIKFIISENTHISFRKIESSTEKCQDRLAS